jgi:carbonic anhydrase
MGREWLVEDRGSRIPARVANVAQQLDNLLSYPSVREAVGAGALRLVGMYSDISQAWVYLVDPAHNSLDPVPVPGTS